MDETPHRLSRKHRKTSSDGTSASGPTITRKSRYAVDDGGDRIECSGKYCKSCSGALIADCVALCCCPCALLNFLTLTLVKVPWMMGKKLLRLRKSKGKKRKSKKKCRTSSASIDHQSRHHQWVVEIEEEEEEEERMPGISCYGFGEEGKEQLECVSARLEAEERVWLELYQIGHLGFGRVSFREIMEGQLGNRI